MLTSVAGRGFAWVAGQEIDLPGAEAAKWADGVRAELVRTEPAETPEDPAVVETPEQPAVVETPEQPPVAEAAARRPARRKTTPRGK
ncbi:hypothetical protein AB0R01_14820 [Streptomyces rochei]|uniref:hypothetical protein n=1 Tax=Streptomyces TaxID=1883 RepID=UPI001CC0F99B|nr:hypothetical protein [Streptomyces sp. A144]UAX56806.1 hypothetical protein K5X85_29195 [Streptomyces sp. A144]